MTDLDPTDEEGAENLGIQWGAGWPKLWATNEEISLEFGDYANDHLNEIAVEHGKRVHGVREHDELTDAQAAGELPYLQALAQVALREMQWALYWRRESVREGDDDPGDEYPKIRRRPQMRQILEGWGPGVTGRTRITGNDGRTFETADDPDAALRAEMRREREAAYRARESARLVVDSGVQATISAAERESRAAYLQQLHAEEDARFPDFESHEIADDESFEDMGYIDFEEFVKQEELREAREAQQTRSVDVPGFMSFEEFVVEEERREVRGAQQAGAKQLVQPLLLLALVKSPTYADQRRRSGRAAPDPEISALALATLMASPAGRSRAQLVQSLGIDHGRLGSLMASLQRILNVDGYPVLRSTDGGNWYAIDETLLREQFELGPADHR